MTGAHDSFILAAYAVAGVVLALMILQTVIAWRRTKT
jgi:heme exporter protein D